VVEFLIDQFGLNSLKAVLQDLGQGKSINQAIADHTTDLGKVEKDFAAFAKRRAQDLAPGLDLEEPKPEDLAKGEDAWISKHPKSFWGLTQRARKLLAEKKWTEAQALAQQLVDSYPESTGADSAYILLAKAYRGLEKPDQERATLLKLARLDAEAVESYARLMELDSTAQDWTAVSRDAQRYLAVNPLVPLPYRFLAQAAERLGKDSESIGAYQTLLLLDPPDPADLHYRLARLLYKSKEPSAKRQVLEALEEAPRFRDAHKLLLEMARAQSGEPARDTGAKPSP
jgi:tetratricopeptide (TPR) repeat protein